MSQVHLQDVDRHLDDVLMAGDGPDVSQRASIGHLPALDEEGLAVGPVGGVCAVGIQESAKPNKETLRPRTRFVVAACSRCRLVVK